MNSREMSVCPVHPIVELANAPESRPVERASRQYALRIAISESLYLKLVAAHQQVRLPDGTRIDLRTLLELAMDALLNERGAIQRPHSSESASNDEAEPITERVPFTMRWPAEA